MQKIILISLVLSSALLATEPKVYVNMSQSLLTHSDNGTVSDFELTGFKWTAGYVVQEFGSVEIALEGSAMLGVNNDSKASVTSASRGTFSNAQEILEKLYNVNLKMMIPIVQNLSVNTYLGASRAKVLSTATNYKSNKAWYNGISYGAGLEYNVLPDVSVHLNYMQYFKNLNGVEFGLGFQF